MNLYEWVKEHYAQYGRQWLHDNFQKACLDMRVHTGKEILNPESYNRTIRRVAYESGLAGIEPQLSSDVSTVEQSVDYHNVDLTKMGIDKVVVNTWGNENNPNKQVKVTLSPKGEEFDVQKLVEEFKEAVKGDKPDFLKPVQRAEIRNPIAYEINIPDAHLGLLAWAKEAGEDYDIKIAPQVYLECVDYFLKHVPHNTEQIILVAGNDYFNSDTLDNTTTKGTRQSEDGRFQKTFNVGWRTLVEAIDRCRKFADVKVMMIPGNHDFTRVHFLGEVLTAYYREDSHVTIDNEPKYYKYLVYGKNLIGYTHGDTAKMEALPMIMAVDMAQQWGHCPHREYHIGHIHTSVTKGFGAEVEKTGCKVVAVPSLAAASDWIARSGYRSLREAQAFVYDKQVGRIAAFHYRPNFTEYFSKA